MRDTIDHDEGDMRRGKAVVRAIERDRRDPGTAGPCLQDLLDHLGRLLAQEYVALLARSRSEKVSRKQDETE